jgi:uncharacterized protein YjbI with pentapeptide repeats
MAGADLTDADMRDGSMAVFDPEKGLTFSDDSPEWVEGVGNVDMRGATLASAKLSGAIAVNSNFEDANLSKATFIRGDLSGANLAGANLVGADLSTCTLKDVNMRGANLVGAKMDLSGLVNVDMSGALTEKPRGKTLETLEMPIDQSLALHKMWLDSKGKTGKKMDMHGYDLRGLKLPGRVDLTMFSAEDTVWFEFDFSHLNIQAAQFKGADLRNCIFDESDMRGSNFSKTKMVGSKLRHARLEPLVIDDRRMMKANFTQAIMRYSDFTGATLRGVDFSGADLGFTDFTDADIQGAIFEGANLERAKINLEDTKKKERA